VKANELIKVIFPARGPSHRDQLRPLLRSVLLRTHARRDSAAYAAPYTTADSSGAALYAEQFRNKHGYYCGDDGSDYYDNKFVHAGITFHEVTRNS